MSQLERGGKERECDTETESNLAMTSCLGKTRVSGYHALNAPTSQTINVVKHDSNSHILQLSNVERVEDRNYLIFDPLNAFFLL